MPFSTVERPNTITLTPQEANYIPSLELLTALKELQLTEGVEAVQNTGRGGYNITFKDTKARQDFQGKYKTLTLLDVTYEVEKTPDITEEPQVKTTYVYIVGLTHELKDKYVCEKLGGNGNLVKTERLRYRDHSEAYNGTRKLTFRPLQREIPQIMYFKGIRAKINYQGQQVKCFHCGEIGDHKAQDCMVSRDEVVRKKERRREERYQEDFPPLVGIPRAVTPLSVSDTEKETEEQEEDEEIQEEIRQRENDEEIEEGEIKEGKEEEKDGIERNNDGGITDKEEESEREERKRKEEKRKEDIESRKREEEEKRKEEIRAKKKREEKKREDEERKQKQEREKTMKKEKAIKQKEKAESGRIDEKAKDRGTKQKEKAETGGRSDEKTKEKRTKTKQKSEASVDAGMVEIIRNKLLYMQNISTTPVQRNTKTRDDKKRCRSEDDETGQIEKMYITPKTTSERKNPMGRHELHQLEK